MFTGILEIVITKQNSDLTELKSVSPREAETGTIS